MSGTHPAPGGVGFQGVPLATDNALVRWDGTTGKFVQNGWTTENDVGALLFNNPSSTSVLTIQQLADTSQPGTASLSIYGGDESGFICHNAKPTNGVSTAGGWSQTDQTNYSFCEEFGQGGFQWAIAKAGAAGDIPFYQSMIHSWVSGQPRFEFAVPPTFKAYTGPGSFSYLSRWTNSDASSTLLTVETPSGSLWSSFTGTKAAPNIQFRLGPADAGIWADSGKLVFTNGNTDRFGIATTICGGMVVRQSLLLTDPAAPTTTGWAFVEAEADGVIAITNGAFTGFTRLQFGGVTAAFPAIGPLTTSGGWGLRLPSAPDTNGQSLNIQTLTELTTIAAAATTDTVIQIPANAIVLGVSVRVTTVIPTAASFTVIGTTSSTAFQTGASVSTAATTTDAGTKSCPYLNATAQTIRITPDVQPAANTGRVRVTIHYLSVTPPTS